MCDHNENCSKDHDHQRKSEDCAKEQIKECHGEDGTQPCARKHKSDGCCCD